MSLGPGLSSACEDSRAFYCERPKNIARDNHYVPGSSAAVRAITGQQDRSLPVDMMFRKFGAKEIAMEFCPKTFIHCLILAL